MAKRKTDHLGIRFEIEYNRDGYEWVILPPPLSGRDTPKQVLAPRGLYRGDFDTRIDVVDTESPLITVSGLEAPRRAVQRFRRLGDSLRELDKANRDAMMLQGIHYPGHEKDSGVFRDSVVEFANEFGPLMGEDDHLSVDEWAKEIRQFRDMCDVSEALRKADFNAIERRITDDDSFGLSYHGTGKVWRIAHPDERIESKVAVNALPAISYPYEAATESPRKRAYMVFTRAVNRKLSSGLSMAIPTMSEGIPLVRPTHLLHTLWAKLAVDTLQYGDTQLTRNCLTCDRAIPETKRRNSKFCSEQCRWDHNNKRRAAL